MRPFGISCFIAGFQDHEPRLFQTEPSGAINEWKANAIGRNSKNLREFLEKKWEANLDETATIRLGIATLLEIVEAASNIDICVLKDGRSFTLPDAQLESVVAELKKEKEEEEAKKKKQ